jgi:Bacterial extracellular solute-binding proteins, family 5 Middle
MCNRLIPMSSRACVVGICSRLASRRGSRCRPGRCLVPRRSGLPEAGPPKRGGILRVRGYDPVHFDHHLTTNFKTNTTLSFVYSRLVRHKVGAGVQPGTFIVEPDLAERWETSDDTTYVFYLRKGVRWHHKPPLNGRELNVPVTVRQVPGGVIFWRTSQEDQQQSQETANRLQTAQQRPQARPRGRRRG